MSLIPFQNISRKIEGGGHRGKRRDYKRRRSRRSQRARFIYDKRYQKGKEYYLVAFKEPNTPNQWIPRQNTQRFRRLIEEYDQRVQIAQVTTLDHKTSPSSRPYTNNNTKNDLFMGIQNKKVDRAYFPGYPPIQPREMRGDFRHTMADYSSINREIHRPNCCPHATLNCGDLQHCFYHPSPLYVSGLFIQKPRTVQHAKSDSLLGPYAQLGTCAISDAPLTLYDQETNIMPYFNSAIFPSNLYSGSAVPLSCIPAISFDPGYEYAVPLTSITMSEFHNEPSSVDGTISEVEIIEFIRRMKCEWMIEAAQGNDNPGLDQEMKRHKRKFEIEDFEIDLPDYLEQSEDESAQFLSDDANYGDDAKYLAKLEEELAVIMIPNPITDQLQKSDRRT